MADKTLHASIEETLNLINENLNQMFDADCDITPEINEEMRVAFQHLDKKMPEPLIPMDEYPEYWGSYLLVEENK